MFSRFRFEMVRRCPSDCIAARYLRIYMWVGNKSSMKLKSSLRSLVGFLYPDEGQLKIGIDFRHTKGITKFKKEELQ